MARKNTTAKIAAIIALIAIFSSVIWTWVLVIFETYFSNNSQNTTLDNEALEELLKNYSWSTSSTWITITSSWTVTSLSWNTLTWITK